MSVFELTECDSPLLVSMPHSGLQLPESIESRLTDEGRALVDTDWHIPRLYHFLGDLNVSVIKANYSRYVVDLNRPCGGDPLYPGQRETEVCPTTTFMDQPLYKAGAELCKDDIEARIPCYWQPYHECLATQLARIKDKYGYALLWDAHSIQSQVPRFFEGALPDLNMGTSEGSSCDKPLSDALYAILEASAYRVVRNGRFKGGYITRHYGKPENGVHTVQMEIAQISYMSEYPDFKYSQCKADKLVVVLKQLIERMQGFWC